jgi:hypothetical protein
MSSVGTVGEHVGLAPELPAFRRLYYWSSDELQENKKITALTHRVATGKARDRNKVRVSERLFEHTSRRPAVLGFRPVPCPPENFAFLDGTGGA